MVFDVVLIGDSHYILFEAKRRTFRKNVSALCIVHRNEQEQKESPPYEYPFAFIVKRKCKLEKVVDIKNLKSGFIFDDDGIPKDFPFSILKFPFSLFNPWRNDKYLGILRKILGESNLSLKDIVSGVNIVFSLVDDTARLYFKEINTDIERIEIIDEDDYVRIITEDNEFISKRVVISSVSNVAPKEFRKYFYSTNSKKSEIYLFSLEKNILKPAPIIFTQPFMLGFPLTEMFKNAKTINENAFMIVKPQLIEDETIERDNQVIDVVNELLPDLDIKEKYFFLSSFYIQKPKYVISEKIEILT